MSCFCLLAQKEGCWEPSLCNFLHELLGRNIILLCTIYSCSMQDVFTVRKGAKRLLFALGNLYTVHHHVTTCF